MEYVHILGKRECAANGASEFKNPGNSTTTKIEKLDPRQWYGERGWGAGGTSLFGLAGKILARMMHYLSNLYFCLFA